MGAQTDRLGVPHRPRGCHTDHRERGLENYSFARIASYQPDPALNGKSIPDVARTLLGKDDLEAQLEVMRRMLRAGGASMVYQFMSEDDISPILRHPFVSIASDSGLNEACTCPAIRSGR